MSWHAWATGRSRSHKEQRPQTQRHHVESHACLVVGTLRLVRRRRPEPGELPVAAGQALERLLSQENQISDLIAFLAALDSEPFLEAFGLPGTHCYVEREELLGKGSGRADLIVRDGSGPMALLEIKVGATQYGDQFARYDSWAKAQTPLAPQPCSARVCCARLPSPGRCTDRRAPTAAGSGRRSCGKVLRR
jgi:hypothetical protein